MTNQLAIVLGVLILLAIGVIALMYGIDPFIYLGKKSLDFIEWIAFWR